jgi:site-specific DNA-methyltransferase (adenine-specific)
MNIELIQGNCLTESDKIKDGSVDLILTDLPYGNMNGAGLDGWKNNKTSWDFAIEPKKIYDIANRILRKNGKMILFSQEPYTSKLITDSIANVPFSYRMVWKKDHFANTLLSKKAPVSYFEDIIVSSKNHEFEGLNPLRPYFKQVFEYIGHTKKTILEQVGQRADHTFRFNSSQFDLCTSETYEALIYFYCIDKMDGFKTYNELEPINEAFKKEFASTFNLWEGGKFKGNVLEYKKDYQGLHPTQKPILLLEDLIKTFSNENDLVVDLTMGSCSTGIACMNTNRNFIGIELDENYFNISKKRVEEKRKEKDLQAGTLFGD